MDLNQTFVSNSSMGKPDTYANAILRTLSSFQPTTPTNSFLFRRHQRRLKSASGSVRDEVSGIKTCLYNHGCVFSSFSHSYFSSGS